ncbi:MAG TPA: orotidine 5'-phosphate decarboxylase, partial [Methanocorpusculum sp.]|nr:orotidine 5'-phosphate decarboxylase [Methanocorpusculum sp.]
MKPILQVALDLTELNRAVQIAKEAVAGGADWIEAGTPLIKSEGMAAVRKLHELFPENKIVADMKISDTGEVEVEMAAKAGADVVCILGTADDSVIASAVRGARLYGVSLMADMMNVKDTAKRAEELQTLGIDIINAHVGIDQQMEGRNPLELLEKLSRSGIKTAAAGGLNKETAPLAAKAGADIIIAGASIIKAADVKKAASEIRDAIDDPKVIRKTEKTIDEKIIELLSQVSAPNVTDAMQRKGSMSGLREKHVPCKMIGKAVTVQTLGGDWSKPVQAIDECSPGDVLVICNDQRCDIAAWGELATRSSENKGIKGIIIDGSVRDWDDIKTLNIPVFAKAVQPNAG